MRGKGKLVIKSFSQEDTTMLDIRNWIIHFEKKWGFKFDIVVLDYLDVVESHKRTKDRNEGELVVVKSFEAMAADFNIPCWTAIQSNRSGFDAEFVEAHQSGGNIKRIQKAHFFMSVAKTPSQKESKLANIRIIKARFAEDGQTFKDCYFNNDTMSIKISDKRYNTTQKIYGEEGLDKVMDKTLRLKKENEELLEKSTQLPIHEKINEKLENKPIEPVDNNIIKKFEKEENKVVENVNEEEKKEIDENEEKKVEDNVLEKSDEKEILSEEEIENLLETDPDSIENDESPVRKILDQLREEQENTKN